VDAQSLSGSVPVGIALHVPFATPFFVAEHAWQSPVHAVLQQTPSTQKPLVHSPAATQAFPTPTCAKSSAPAIGVPTEVPPATSTLPFAKRMALPFACSLASSPAPNHASSVGS
jgi:hypothetical protein